MVGTHIDLILDIMFNVISKLFFCSKWVVSATVVNNLM